MNPTEVLMPTASVVMDADLVDFPPHLLVTLPQDLSSRAHTPSAARHLCHAQVIYLVLVFGPLQVRVVKIGRAFGDGPSSVLFFHLTLGHH